MVDASPRPAETPKRQTPVIMETGSHVTGFASEKRRLFNQTDPTEKKPDTMTL